MRAHLKKEVECSEEMIYVYNQDEECLWSEEMEPATIRLWEMNADYDC